MANEENLIPLNKRTPRERKEIAQKGAKATNKKKAERKKFNELFNSYLDKKVTDKQVKEQMLQFGFTDEECTNKNAIVFAQYKEALKGSTQAFVAVRDTMGEKPVEQIQNINPPVINIERPKKDG
jgi:DNA helicase IV